MGERITLRVLRLRQKFPTLIPYVGSLLVKFGGAGFSFIATILIARIYGASVAGAYGMSVQTTMTASAFALFGNDQLLTRRIAGDLNNGRLDLARGTFDRAMRIVGVASLILAILLVSSSPFAYAIGTEPINIAISAGGVLVFPLLGLAVAVMRVTGRVITSQFFYGCMQSILVVVFLLGIELTERQQGANLIVMIYTVSIVITSLTGLAVTRHIVSAWPKPSAEVEYGAFESRHIGFAAAIHMLTIWTVMALAGALLGLAEVGALRVCLQILTIITMIVNTLETIVAPGFAAAFRAGDMALVRQRHRRATMLMVSFAGPPILLCVIFAHPILSVFGPDFVGATTALQVLIAGQVVPVLIGPVGSILVMGNAERTNLVVSLVGYMFAVVLIWLLTPHFGLIGAAIAYAGALIVRNVASLFAVRWQIREFLARRGSKPSSRQL